MKSTQGLLRYARTPATADVSEGPAGGRCGNGRFDPRRAAETEWDKCEDERNRVQAARGEAGSIRAQTMQNGQQIGATSSGYSGVSEAN